MFQRPLGNRDWRVTARLTDSTLQPSGGARPFRTRAHGLVGEMIFGSSSFDVGLGHERLSADGTRRRALACRVGCPDQDRRVHPVDRGAVRPDRRRGRAIRSTGPAVRRRPGPLPERGDQRREWTPRPRRHRVRGDRPGRRPCCRPATASERLIGNGRGPGARNPAASLAGSIGGAPWTGPLPRGRCLGGGKRERAGLDQQASELDAQVSGAGRPRKSRCRSSGICPGSGKEAEQVAGAAFIRLTEDSGSSSANRAVSLLRSIYRRLCVDFEGLPNPVDLRLAGVGKYHRNRQRRISTPAEVLPCWKKGIEEAVSTPCVRRFLVRPLHQHAAARGAGAKPGPRGDGGAGLPGRRDQGGHAA